MAETRRPSLAVAPQISSLKRSKSFFVRHRKVVDRPAYHPIVLVHSSMPSGPSEGAESAPGLTESSRVSDRTPTSPRQPAPLMLQMWTRLLGFFVETSLSTEGRRRGGRGTANPAERLVHR